MSMHTRCTHCEAVFRVTLLQLQSSSGRVRCGVCQEVFDAFVHLRAADPPPPEPVLPPAPLPQIDLPEEAPAPDDAGFAPEAVEESTSPDAPEDHIAAGEGVATAPSQTAADEIPSATLPPIDEFFIDEIPAPAPSADTSFTAPAEDTPGEAEGWPSEEDEPNATTGAASDAPATGWSSETDSPKPALAVPPPAARRARWPLVAGVSAAVLALAAQAAYQFRTPIATALPALRPALESACAMAGCDVPLPRLPERLVIETSDLRALDPARPNRVVLATTIRNAAPVAQAYPMLELSLTDARDKVTARKVFSPQEYLEAPSPKGAGLGADAEFSVRMQLDIGDIEASGYRIYLFHR
jgi:predicted Zn finger-like uncharacterized protein